MRTQTRGWASGWATMARALAAGLLLVAAMAGAVAAGQARAATTFSVNLPTDVAEDNSADRLCDVAPAAGGSHSARLGRPSGRPTSPWGSTPSTSPSPVRACRR